MTTIIRKPVAGTVPPLQSGTTAQRPAPSFVNQTYFDTTLGYQIAAKQLAPAIWVDSAGVQV
ncbi:hypothetical protein WI28_23045 [Burkholderia diffusa]|uniref:hypothetical protein n=1 Tax=Burkholderia diffusa TaxID=488732 RepID=UPI0007566F03|nr:hypothetical protein [Burkholderia diffusa]KUZ07001.1 hypothetical protein WI28_23045 [Burkholderia diffusa]